MFTNLKIKKYLKRADSLFNSKDYDGALEYYDKVLSLEANHIKSLYKKAYILYTKESMMMLLMF